MGIFRLVTEYFKSYDFKIRKFKLNLIWKMLRIKKEKMKTKAYA